jgi:hypothetical protein
MITLAASVSPSLPRPAAPAGGGANGAAFVLPDLAMAGLDGVGRQVDAGTGTSLPALSLTAATLPAVSEGPTILPAMTAADAISLRIMPAGGDGPPQPDTPAPPGRSASTTDAVPVVAMPVGVRQVAPGKLLATAIGQVAPSAAPLAIAPLPIAPLPIALPPVAGTSPGPFLSLPAEPIILVATSAAMPLLSASAGTVTPALATDAPTSPTPVPPAPEGPLATSLPEQGEALTPHAASIAPTMPPSAGSPVATGVAVTPLAARPWSSAAATTSQPADDPVATAMPVDGAASPGAPPPVVPRDESPAPSSHARDLLPSDAHVSHGPSRRTGNGETIPVVADEPARSTDAPPSAPTEDDDAAPATSIAATPIAPTPIIALTAPAPFVVAPPPAPIAVAPTGGRSTAPAIGRVADAGLVPARSSATTSVAEATMPRPSVPSTPEAATIAPAPTPRTASTPLPEVVPASGSAAPSLAATAPTAIAGATALPTPTAPAAPPIPVIVTTPAAGLSPAPPAPASPAPAAEPLARTPDPTNATTPEPAAPVTAAFSTPAPAAIVFGAAIAAAHEQDRRAAESTPTTTLDLVGAGILGTDRAVATHAAPLPATIDTTDARWPQAMISRIETLRDAVDAADTRIRLIPDALGTIDVAVRRDGDAVHVHFTAEQPQTRALLQDAQPRLADAAEQRGVRLGQTSVDGGSPSSQNGFAQNGFAQNGQGQPRQPAPDPRRPAPAFTPRPRAPVDTVDDARIA